MWFSTSDFRCVAFLKSALSMDWPFNFVLLYSRVDGTVCPYRLIQQLYSWWFRKCWWAFVVFVVVNCFRSFSVGEGKSLPQIFDWLDKRIAWDLFKQPTQVLILLSNSVNRSCTISFSNVWNSFGICNFCFIVGLPFLLNLPPKHYTQYVYYSLFTIQHSVL